MRANILPTNFLFKRSQLAEISQTFFNLQILKLELKQKIFGGKVTLKAILKLHFGEMKKLTVACDCKLMYFGLVFSYAKLGCALHGCIGYSIFNNLYLILYLQTCIQALQMGWINIRDINKLKLKRILTIICIGRVFITLQKYPLYNLPHLDYAEFP